MEEQRFETLGEFKEWLLSSDGPGILGGIPVQNPMHFKEGLSAATLCRRGAFQAELLIGRPGLTYILHDSDGVERLLTFLGGEAWGVVDVWNGGFTSDDAYEGLNAYHDDPAETYHPSRGATLHVPKERDLQISFLQEGGVLLMFEKRSSGPHISCLEAITIEESSS